MHGKRDANHQEIREQFRANHFTVFDTGDVGGGFPDLVVSPPVWMHASSASFLVEVKTDSGSFTDAQLGFYRNWSGMVLVIRSVDDIIDLMDGRPVECWVNGEHTHIPIYDMKSLKSIRDRDNQIEAMADEICVLKSKHEELARMIVDLCENSPCVSCQAGDKVRLLAGKLVSR